LFPKYWAFLAAYYTIRAEYQKSLATVARGFRVAESAGDDLLIHIMHWVHGYNLLWLGELRGALSQLEKMIVFYDPIKHRELHHFYGSDPGSVCRIWSSWTLWLLGYPEKALRYCQQAIDLGLSLGDPDSQVNPQLLTAFLRLLMRDPEGSNDLLQSCSFLLTQNSRPLFSADLEFIQGFYRVQIGEPEAGLASISRGLDAWQAIGTRNMLSMKFTLKAETFLRIGQVDQAIKQIQQAEEFIEDTDERFYQAETLRIKGEILLHQSASSMKEAEACFLQAMQVAQGQEAKTLELRAAMSLAHLWQTQSRLVEAQRVLARVYNWFTEGFDNPDLLEARALLRELNL
jgi:tetratricopeptide (TPR) repeat protein